MAGFKILRGDNYTIEPVVPMVHKMGGERSMEQVQAVEWPEGHPKEHCDEYVVEVAEIDAAVLKQQTGMWFRANHFIENQTEYYPKRVKV